MKLSTGFWQTYKEVPADAVIPSHQLMLRAGLLAKSGSGLYSYLPFCLKVIEKIKNIIREELEKIPCYEVSMTIVTPGELWQETGRWEKMGDQMLKLKDKGDRDLCISPTNEEVITDIFRKSVKSYKQLPVTLYQINTKFRDEIRPRFGLMRAREFLMKDAYSFHMDKNCLSETYQKLFNAYGEILNRVGLEFIPVEADGGVISGKDNQTHEFQVIADNGEDTLIYCSKCKYAANVEKAETKKITKNNITTKNKMETIDTPEKDSIESVSKFLKISPEQMLKCLLYESIVEEESEKYLVVLSGDDNLNELKLQSIANADHLKPLSNQQIKDLNLIKGYIGPFNMDKEIKIIVDKNVNLSSSYITGANEVNKHVKNFIPERDISEYKIFDLREAKSGDGCINCNELVIEKRGIEVGHIFELGNDYSKKMEAGVLDNNGKKVFPQMGCYGIGVTRILAAAIEQLHDENGIVWPKSISPFQVYLAIIGKSDEIKKIGSEIYDELRQNGLEVLLDDRNAGPGFKFKDSDLLGLPFRVTLGERDFKANGTLEIKCRKSGKSFNCQRSELVNKLQTELDNLL